MRLACQMYLLTIVVITSIMRMALASAGARKPQFRSLADRGLP
jgi:hypothetical protein